MLNVLTRMTIRWQLIIVIILLISPILLLYWMASEKTEDILKNQVTDAYVELIKQNHAIIDRDLDTVSRIMTTIIQNPLTQSFAPRALELDSMNHVQSYQEMNEFLASYSMGIDGGQTIRYSFFVPDAGNQFSFAPNYQSRNTSFVFFYDQDEQPVWVNEAVELKGKAILRIIEDSGPAPDRTLALIRAVNMLSEGNQVIGVLIATNLDNKIGDSVKSITLPEGSDIAIADLNDRLYYGTDQAAGIGDQIRLPLPEALTPSTADVSYAIDEDDIHVIHANYLMKHKMIYRIPTHSLVEQQNEVKSTILFLSGAYFILFFLVMLYFLRSLITPLFKMLTFFKSYEPGKSLPELRELDRKDEIGSLIASIHDMASRFNQLVHDKYIMEIRHKEAQLNLLYQQINPHLLYNTLESVYWKCMLQGENEAADMIKDLSKLMRISLSRGRELIRLDEELEHAMAYVNLQQKRFEYGFKVVWHIAEHVRDALIPKVSLQPIIENAILHGVRYMEDDGEIMITAFSTSDRVYVWIEDNGYKEMDIEAAQQSLDIQEDQPVTGYGARNVHKRIQLHYGPEYGLHYERRAGQGTRVCITLPIHEHEPS
jgi:two-component system sensor histidine kinase YesM